MIQQIQKISDAILSKMRLTSNCHRQFLVALFGAWFIVQGRHNIRNLSRYSTYSESMISRRMDQEVDFGGFHQQTVELVLDPERRSDWIMGGDCSFIPKSGKATYGKALFWNGSADKQQSGLEISGFALINPETKEAYMVDVWQTPGDLSSREGECGEYTRIDFYLDHLRRAYRRYYWIRYVALDGYYAKIKTLDYFDGQEGLFVISKLRKDANLKFYLDRESKPEAHGNQTYDGKFDHKNPMSQKQQWIYEGVLEDEPEVEIYRAHLYSPHFKRKLNVTLCWHAEQKRHILLFSDDLDLSGIKMAGYYKSRFQIEFLFRDAKQHSGLNEAQVRDQQKLDFHFNFSFAAVNLGRVVAGQNQREDYTFNNTKRLGYNQIILNKFIANLELDPKLPKVRDAFEKTAEFGLMRA